VEILMTAEKNILIIQTAFPGDAILTLPFIQELKKKHPESLIDVICIPATEEIFSASSQVNSVIVLEKRGKHKSILSFIKFTRELKSKNYEVVYSPHRSFRSALISLSLSAKESYGFENSSLPFAFNKVVKYDYSAHEVKRNLQLFGEEYSGEKWKILPEIVIPEESRKKVSKFLKDNNIDKFISIAPGSVWETKKYPVEYFKKIVQHFVSSKIKAVLIGGNSDKALCEDVKKENDKDVFITAGDFSFIDSIELLKKSSLLICNDSAPTHLGVCADIPVLTIYCSTIPGFGFYPYNSKSDYVSYDDLICKPCGIHGFKVCPLDHFNCAKQLSLDMVIEKAEKLLLDAN
jgi:heptosyltransferase II